MPAAEGVELIEFAMAQMVEEKLFARWINGAQYQMSFDAFNKALTPPKFKDNAALLADVEKIVNGGANGNI